MAKRTLTADEKYVLITSNLQEVISGDIIKKILPERDISIYWGTATTGRPHAAYLVPAIKVAQFLQAGCTVKVLLADLHAFLDADKAPECVLENRAQYYERIIRSLLSSVGVDLSRLEFVRGSSYQLTPEYMRDLLRLSKKVSVHDALRASSEIVKVMGEPCMADGLYPLMQLLDEEYLKVDAEFGGLDQRKIFGLSHDAMPKLGFKNRCHLMNPMVPGLSGGKMSSSDPKSKIDLLEDSASIKKKISKAVCAPRETDGNGVLSFIEHVIFPYSQLQSENGVGSVSVTLKDATEPTVFTNFADLAAAYAEDSLTPQLAKRIVEEGLTKLTDSIRAEFAADARWQEIAAAAYPEPVVPVKVKKEKKQKKPRGERPDDAASTATGKQDEKKSNVVVPVEETV
ncbi:Tyrosine--tRNA ligase cytoplasmic [Ceratocystis pirilliformis]|uniref:Tyrosine--tRNA ligase n=1 Tax=Ceratocystis pirilliformis TaxID=259994 RepID=A0ABR3Z862_9PEZI